MKIASLQNGDGSTLTDENDIISKFIKFYSNFIGVANYDCNGGSEDLFQSLHLASLFH